MTATTGLLLILLKTLRTSPECLLLIRPLKIDLIYPGVITNLGARYQFPNQIAVNEHCKYYQANFYDHRLGGPTEDYVNKDGIFGPIKATSLNTKPISATIAEPYAWFANEAFWSEECKRTFDAPEEGDSDDPACDGKPCIEPPHK